MWPFGGEWTTSMSPSGQPASFASPSITVRTRGTASSRVSVARQSCPSASTRRDPGDRRAARPATGPRPFRAPASGCAGGARVGREGRPRRPRSERRHLVRPVLPPVPCHGPRRRRTPPAPAGRVRAWPVSRRWALTRSSPAEAGAPPVLLAWERDAPDAAAGSVITREQFPGCARPARTGGRALTRGGGPRGQRPV